MRKSKKHFDFESVRDYFYNLGMSLLSNHFSSIQYESK